MDISINIPSFKYDVIRSCCSLKSLTAYGFIWRYKTNPLPKDFIKKKHLLSKQVLQYSKDGELIKTWDSLQQIKDELKLYVSDCCREIISSSGGFIWRYEGNELNPNYSFPLPKTCKSILQLDLNNSIIKEWPSISKAKEFIKGDISSCLKKKTKTAGNYKWKYKI